MFLIFTLISSASAKGKLTTKTKQKPKPTKDSSLKSCVYQTPAGFSNDPVATKSKYTVTVTAGITVSTSVYGIVYFAAYLTNENLMMAVVSWKIPQKNVPLHNVTEHAPRSQKMARRVPHKEA
ncbi:hypothetical protein EAF00_004533 [Botryotinia globosa]|nr:hypothetical protein EAF00_004533 [Botryotinia globosa]